MKLTKSKILLILSGLAVLGLLVMPIKSLVLKVNAEPFVYNIRILEVTNSGESDLKSLTAANIIVDTMSMNRFVSLRDDFDGKYDAVYIGKGTYSKYDNSGKSDDSSDITSLKAKEISDYYINKGLTVIFNNASFESQTGILYTSFNKYRTDSPRQNVRFVSDSDLSTFINDINSDSTDVLRMLKQRPRLTITNKSDITDYSQNPDYLYRPGDTLDFKFNAANVEDLNNHPILVKLYVSRDKSVPMTESQVAAATTLDQSPNGEITYTLPKTTSGLLYWKLEISDHLSATKLKDYDSGVIRFRGKQKVLNILQVLPSVGNSERTSSLLDPNNMNQSYLNTEDYRFNITAKPVSEFNNDIAAQYELDGTYGLNGVYDMLILGFRNSGNTSLTDRAAQAVIDYAKVTRQSVILANDAVYHGNSPAARAWEQYFMDIAGQIDPQKNSNVNAPYAAESVKPVNDGLLAHYPFYLSALNAHNEQTDIITPEISTAHNPSYSLNLEDPEIIPWYNIIGANRDSDDSANHYYTYTKGNIIYSATGHILGTPSKEHFPDWEQKLFVNMMYRGYIGSNHKPEITVHLPQQNDTVPTYQNGITVDYKVEDPDPEDQELYTTIRFKSNGVYLTNTGMPETSILSGKTVHATFANPLPDGGPLTIEITARDKQGALTVTSIDITVLKASANLELTRTLSSNVNASGEVAMDEAFTITYSVKPKSIPFDQAGTANQSSAALTISDIRFLETLPANLERNGDWPAGISVSGDGSAGYTLSKSLGSITYTLKTVDGVKTYVPDSAGPIVFSINVRAAVANTYHFDTAKVSFVDVHPVLAATETPTAVATTSPSPTVTTASPAATGTTPASSNFDPSVSSSGSSLGIAGDYNAFVFGPANVTASLKGNLAAGGNTTISGAEINESNGSRVPYAIVTGGDLDFQNGTVYGNILHQGSYTKVDSGNILNGTYKKGSLIDFEAARSYYQILSDKLADVTPNGTYDKDLNLSGTGTGTDSIVAFKIESKTFENAGWPNVSQISGKNIIYTITTKDKDKDKDVITLNKAFGLPSGVSGDHVIYNFPDAETVNISGVEINGSVLAPRGVLNFTNGQIHGNVIAAALNASSLIDIKSYAGPLPIVMPTATPAATPTPTSSPSPVPTPSTTPSPTILYFPKMTVTAVERITRLTVSDTTLLIGDQQKLSRTIEPTSRAADPLNWSSSNDSIVSVDSGGVVYGRSAGTAVITASTTDGRNLNSSATVTVLNPPSPAPSPSVQPSPSVTPSPTISSSPTTSPSPTKPADRTLSLRADKDRVVINESVALTAAYSNSNETGVQYTWSAVDNMGNPVSITSSQGSANFSAVKSGVYTITVSVISDQFNEAITQTKEITVGLNSLTIGYLSTVFVNNTITLTALPDPVAPEEEYEWHLVNNGDISYGGFTDDQGVIKANAAGNTVEFKGIQPSGGIQVVVTAAGITSPPFTIKVLSEPNLEFSPDYGVISINQSLNLYSLLHTIDPYGDIPASLAGKLVWRIEGNHEAPAVTLNVTNKSTVIITGIREGTERIKVSYPKGTGETATAYYTIKVVDPDTADHRY
ncbi:DUF5057 domain-containing protein [Paenibacillus rhizophilus]|uniref:DUF5057 domain-containing protein n=1 Tax=Paenibacillus rhizophilus TaxID=1850366 RepID=A0A3N9PUJ7_9BACL|nr:DUF5057 domain-containing protein [Paenibacillus rhizophilus]RQW10082.1 DUF5057 domain-containing protein [Paenibacillus rhizophilus]